MFNSFTDLLGGGRDPERASAPVSVYRILSASFPSQERHMGGDGQLQGEGRNEGHVHRLAPSGGAIQGEGGSQEEFRS